MPTTLTSEQARARFDRVREMLARDATADEVAAAEDLHVSAAWNLICRTRKHFGERIGGTTARRPWWLVAVMLDGSRRVVATYSTQERAETSAESGWWTGPLHVEDHR